MLNINKTVDNGTATIALEGRLDTVTSPDLEATIKDTVEGLNELILDFDKLEYISSAGLRVLLAAHKTMSKAGGMKVVNVNSAIMEIFEVTGFSDILEIA
ncbi:anti-sigma B factor antagonist [Ruminococcaceae bacterium YRB3002]|nr:anti-sigma B factor antagonist [Ruminococcaceae bacterium YRB3002]